MNDKILNLDLGPNPFYREIKVGPYHIFLVDDYDAIQPKISEGITQTTAIVNCEKSVDSLLTSDRETKGKGIWDIRLIFSYLTGRMCLSPGQERRYTSVKQGDSIVENHVLPQAAQTMWENRKYIIKEKRPFWYYLGMIDTAEAEYKAIFGCIALEIIQKIEVDNNYISDNLKILKDSVIKLIENSGLKNINELKSAVGMWGINSYFQGLLRLLEKFNFISSNLDTESFQYKRIKSIHSIRNDIAHGNKIKFPKWIKGDKEQRCEYIFICSIFIQNLVQEYLNRIFKLKSFYQPNRNYELLSEYIHKGTWENRQIIDVCRDGI